MGAAAALVASTTPRQKVGYALGMLQTGQFTANMLGPVIGGAVSATLGIRESFIFCAALYVLAAGLVYVFVKERPVEEEPAVTPGKEKPKGGSFVENIRAVVSERQVVVMLLLLFALWLSTTFVRPVMPISIDNFSTDEHVKIDLPFWRATSKRKRPPASSSA